MKRSYFTFIILISVFKPWFSLTFAQITTQPQNIQLCYGSSGLLITKGDSLARFIWQDSSNTGWNDIITSTIFSGISNDTLQIISPPLTINNFRFRCILDSNGTGVRIDTTNSATTTVFNPLTKTIISSNRNICYNMHADTLKLTQSTTGGNNLFNNQWQPLNSAHNLIFFNN
jgi:hypothetical protein